MNANHMADKKTNLQDEKLRAEINKMIAETGQIQVRAILVPFLAAAGLIGATAAIVKILL